MGLLMSFISPFCVTYPLSVSFHSLCHWRLTALQVVVVCAAVVREQTCVEVLVSLTVH